MKVHVYARDGFPNTIMIESTPGKGRPPIVLNGVTAENIVDVLEHTIKEMRRPRGQELEPLP